MKGLDTVAAYKKCLPPNVGDIADSLGDKIRHVNRFVTLAETYPEGWATVAEYRKV